MQIYATEAKQKADSLSLRVKDMFTKQLSECPFQV